MMMGPGTRKLSLLAHVTSSVGWLGAVACFLALAIIGLRSSDAQEVRATWLAMRMTTWWVIVPLSFASLVTGLVQSLGTNWGLFRHYWVVAKLILTVGATLLLLVHTEPVDYLATVARSVTPLGPEERRVQIQLVVDAAAALAVLLAAAFLSIYKPKGVTPLGLRSEGGGGVEQS